MSLLLLFFQLLLLFLHASFIATVTLIEIEKQLEQKSKNCGYVQSVFSMVVVFFASYDQIECEIEIHII